MEKEKEKVDGFSEDLKIYNKYKARFNIPDYAKVQKFLELSCLEDDGLLLITIKKKIVNKIESYIDIIDPVVHPDSSVNSIYENSFFTEEEKNSIFVLFRKLMVLQKEASLADLDESDEANAKFIGGFFLSYPEIKKELDRIIHKEMDSWQKEETRKVDRVGYMG